MKNLYYKLDEQGNPIPTDDLSLIDDPNRVVAKTKVGETVFLMIDHQYGDGPPLLWETMIFGGNHDDYIQRYSSREDAVRGHNAVVTVLQEELRRRENQE